MPGLEHPLSIVGMKHPLPAIALQVFQPYSHIGAPTRVAIVKGAVRRAAPDLLRDRIDQHLPPLFGALAVLDIGTRSVPLNDLPLLVAQRRRANEKPPILPVRPPQAHFILKWFPGGNVSAPFFRGAWEVFRMNWTRGLFQFLLQRKTCVVQPTLIDEINHAVRPETPGHRGNRIDDEAKKLFRMWLRSRHHGSILDLLPMAEQARELRAGNRLPHYRV